MFLSTIFTIAKCWKLETLTFMKRDNIWMPARAQHSGMTKRAHYLRQEPVSFYRGVSCKGIFKAIDSIHNSITPQALRTKIVRMGISVCVCVCVCWFVTIPWLFLYCFILYYFCYLIFFIEMSRINVLFLSFYIEWRSEAVGKI